VASYVQARPSRGDILRISRRDRRGKRHVLMLCSSIGRLYVRRDGSPTPAWGRRRVPANRPDVKAVSYRNRLIVALPSTFRQQGCQVAIAQERTGDGTKLANGRGARRADPRSPRGHHRIPEPATAPEPDRAGRETEGPRGQDVTDMTF
jgi:hypothetical protein